MLFAWILLKCALTTTDISRNDNVGGIVKYIVYLECGLTLCELQLGLMVMEEMYCNASMKDLMVDRW